MGSGSSKAKPKTSSPVSRPDKVSKLQSRDPQSVPAKREISDRDSKTQIVETEIVKNDKNFQKSSESNDRIIPNTNGNVNKVQKIETVHQSFESDSESDAEDIDAVLASTRADHDYRTKQTLSKPTEYYPETYAQRLQREQYEKAAEGIMRQKTIYRNPDEWDLNEGKNNGNWNSEEFDVSKFKEANVVKPPPNPVNRDIFSPSDITEKSNGYQGKTDRYYTQTNNHKTDSSSFPRYDTSEEALLAEIEQEYDL